MKNELTLERLQQITDQLAAESALNPPESLRTTNQLKNHPFDVAETMAKFKEKLSFLPPNVAGGLFPDFWKTSPAETPEEIEKLKDVLSHLSSDVPRGNGSFYDADEQPREDHWLAVVWAIASLGWGQGKSIAKEWSKSSSRYTDDGFDTAWHGFRPDHHNPVGVGSLYKRAKELGWQAPQMVPQTANAARYKLLGRAEIMAMQPISWLIKGVFPATGLGALYGPAGSGKSFLAFDCAAAIADGAAWFGFKTKAHPIVYTALEGESGYKLRVQAWEKAYQKDLPPTLSLIVQPFRITDPQDVRDLGSAVAPGSTIFVDTLNRASPTSDENSSKDMGEILEGAKRLQELTGGLVLLIAHTGKDTSKGVRGHSSLFAALDAAIEVERTVNGRSWSVAKAKDSTDGQGFPFKLKVHDLGKDSDGDPLTSCTVERDFGQILQKPEPKGKDQKQALKVLKQAIPNSKHVGKAGCGSTTPCISVEDAVTCIASTLTTTKISKRSNRARTLVKGLVDGGFVSSGFDGDEAWVWLD